MQMLISKPSLLRKEADAVYQKKEEVFFHTPWQLSHPLKGLQTPPAAGLLQTGCSRIRDRQPGQLEVSVNFRPFLFHRLPLLPEYQQVRVTGI